MTGKKKPSSEEHIIPSTIEGNNEATRLLNYIVEQDFWYIKRREKWFAPDGRLLSTEELYLEFLKEKE